MNWSPGALTSDLSPRSGLLCLPTLSTHGYEVIRRKAIPRNDSSPGRVPAAIAR
jgi:hypothetical protein